MHGDPKTITIYCLQKSELQFLNLKYYAIIEKVINYFWGYSIFFQSFSGLNEQLFQLLYFRNQHLEIDFFRHVNHLLFGDFPEMIMCPREISLKPELLGVNLLVSSAYLSS